MVGRFTQLTAQLCDYSGWDRLGRRRREEYVPPRGEDYEGPRGRGEYEGERGRNERHDGRYPDRVVVAVATNTTTSYEDPEDGVSYRVRRVREDQDWDGCRGLAPWCRDGAGGDGRAVFSAEISRF